MRLLHFHPVCTGHFERTTPSLQAVFAPFLLKEAISVQNACQLVNLHQSKNNCFSLNKCKIFRFIHQFLKPFHSGLDQRTTHSSATFS